MRHHCFNTLYHSWRGSPAHHYHLLLKSHPHQNLWRWLTWGGWGLAKKNIEKNCPFLTRGRTSRAGPTTASQPTWRYVTFSPYSGFELFLHQQVDQETNNSKTQEAAKKAEHLDMTSLPSDSKKVKRLRKEAIWSAVKQNMFFATGYCWGRLGSGTEWKLGVQGGF